MKVTVGEVLGKAFEMVSIIGVAIGLYFFIEYAFFTMEFTEELTKEDREYLVALRFLAIMCAAVYIVVVFFVTENVLTRAISWFMDQEIEIDERFENIYKKL